MGLFDSILSGIFSGGSDDKGCDWYCDECDAHMNSQPGFTTSSGEWTCTKCGYVNDVTEDNILDEYENPYDDNDDDDDDDGEGLSVSDAADIWRSHGEDEDYMFGYTREELEDA